MLPKYGAAQRQANRPVATCADMNRFLSFGWTDLHHELPDD
jgi:hypothetical protein